MNSKYGNIISQEEFCNCRLLHGKLVQFKCTVYIVYLRMFVQYVWKIYLYGIFVQYVHASDLRSLKFKEILNFKLKKMYFNVFC